jgi:parvulin-like peptidyl-prolyl isomerase
MNKKTLSIALTAIVLSLLMGCNANNENGEWIAKVGNTPIFKSTLEEKVGQLSPEIKQQISTNTQARINVITQLMNGLVSDTLILEDAKKTGYEANADYIAASEQLEKRISDQRKQALITLYLRDNIDKDITVTDQEIINFYNNNQNKFTAFELRKASHILLKTKAEAESVRQKLRANGDFAALAKEYSIDASTSQKGGDVGEFNKSGSPKEFIDVAYGLRRVGTVSNVFESPLGFHIVKLTGKRTVEERKLQDIAADLKRQLYTAKRNQALQQLINDLKEKYPVTVKENKPAEETTAEAS